MIQEADHVVGADASAPPLNWQRFLGRRRSAVMTEDEKAYFQDRAEAEILLAQRADHPEVVRTHYLLAGYYLDLVHSGEGEPPPAG
jgi:hypothetical protein